MKRMSGSFEAWENEECGCEVVVRLVWVPEADGLFRREPISLAHQREIGCCDSHPELRQVIDDTWERIASRSESDNQGGE